MSTRIEDLQEHARQAAAKLKDVSEAHLPEVTKFLAEVAANPLVTSVEASAGRTVTSDAQAILNGLTSLFSAVGGAGAPAAPPAAAAAPEF